MKIKAIVVQDLRNPIEIQSWFDENPGIVLHLAEIGEGVFYLYYE